MQGSTDWTSYHSIQQQQTCVRCNLWTITWKEFKTQNVTCSTLINQYVQYCRGMGRSFVIEWNSNYMTLSKSLQICKTLNVCSLMFSWHWQRSGTSVAMVQVKSSWWLGFSLHHQADTGVACGVRGWQTVQSTNHNIHIFLTSAISGCMRNPSSLA